MQRNNKFTLTTLIIAAGVGLAGAYAYAYAEQPEENDTSAATTNISLQQAIATAERYAHGKAVRAEYGNTPQGGRIEVEVVIGAKVLDLKIDADKGNVISSVEDHADHRSEDRDD